MKKGRGSCDPRPFLLPRSYSELTNPRPKAGAASDQKRRSTASDQVRGMAGAPDTMPSELAVASLLVMK